MVYSIFMAQPQLCPSISYTGWGIFRSFVFKGFSRHPSRRMWRYALHPFLVYIGKTAVEVERIGTEMLFKLIWETTYNRILQKKSDLIWIGI